MPSHIQRTSINSMADAFKASASVIALGLKAHAQLRRQNLKPKTVRKWHRLATITAIVLQK